MAKPNRDRPPRTGPTATYAKAEASFARCFNTDSPDIVLAHVKGGRLDADVVSDKLVGWLMVDDATA